ncbi:Dipeptidyl aminopeptidase [Nowakowskiella sp. JEL0407]|nr:Dipeptidyl aminopeptidase [Nowakowskiella sp. JEL0407]
MFGHFKSPISSSILSASSIRFSDLVVDEVKGKLYFTEGRPVQGKQVLVEYSSSTKELKDVCQGENVRTGVHEYGGSPATVRNGIKVFSESKTLRLFVENGSGLSPLTPETGVDRFADINIHPSLEYLVCVNEHHQSPSTPDTVENRIVLIDLKSPGTEPVIILSGQDFYTSPRFSHDGSHIAWIQWDHPSMQWQNSLLCIAKWNSKGKIESKDVLVVENVGNESIAVSQPKWGINNKLYFCSDRSGYANIYEFDVVSRDKRCLWSLNEDFAKPDWVFGLSSFDFLSDGRIVAFHISKGFSKLSVIDPKTLQHVDINNDYVEISSLRIIRAIKPSDTDSIIILGSTAIAPETLYERKLIECSDSVLLSEGYLIKETVSVPISASYFSKPEMIEFSTRNGEFAYAIFYMPKNSDYDVDALLKEGKRPPVIIRCHGGPTSSSGPGLNLKVQYWTSRGFAFADVNYGGSSGYGRQYVDRLNGNWGILDVTDTIDLAEYLVSNKQVHSAKFAITGQSAGGYTVLQTATSILPHRFKAFTSSYGISSLSHLASDTHKFEAHYMTSLLGGTLQSHTEVYEKRSPINFPERVGKDGKSLLILQGGKDAVVPPNQAKMFVEKVKEKGGNIKMVVFDGEGHGWKNADNIKAAVEEELNFYLRVFE